MADLHLQCNSCDTQITITSKDEKSKFFIDHYGQIDKVTGRIFEMDCLLCSGVLEESGQHE